MLAQPHPGVAGPGSSGGGRDPGLTHVAVAGPGSVVEAEVISGDAGREENRARAVRAALRLCARRVGGADP